MRKQKQEKKKKKNEDIHIALGPIVGSGDSALFTSDRCPRSSQIHTHTRARTRYQQLYFRSMYTCLIIMAFVQMCARCLVCKGKPHYIDTQAGRRKGQLGLLLVGEARAHDCQKKKSIGNGMLVEVQKSLPLSLSLTAIYACATYVLLLLFSPWLVYIYPTGPFVSFPSVCFFYLLSLPLSLSLSLFFSTPGAA